MRWLNSLGQVSKEYILKIIYMILSLPELVCVIATVCVAIDWGIIIQRCNIGEYSKEHSYCDLFLSTILLQVENMKHTRMQPRDHESRVSREESGSGAVARARPPE